jgi:C-terminal processing protease CtpA/Prc
VETDAYAGRVIILVDRYTGSAAEDFVMPFEGIGINPDVSVEPSIADVRDSKDPVLQKAVEIAKTSQW